MPDRPAEPAVLPAFGRFVHENKLKVLVTCCVLLFPCLWHREIACSDLGSHLYNAWLAQLIRHGQVPGLWIVPQHTNVLFDLLLSWFGAIFGLHAGEKIAVSISVLVFFWGLFALVSAVARRAPWYLAPCIALFTYGWTFQLGFFNYYLSLGLSFFAIAILWRGAKREWIIAAAIGLVALVAHPLGFLWLVAAAAYVVVGELLPKQRYQLALFLAGAAGVFEIHRYLWRHYNVYAGTGPAYVFNGADQLLLFGARYRVPEFAFIAFALVALAMDIIQRRREPGLWRFYALPLQLYLLVELSVQLFPGGVHLPPPTATPALLTERLTSVSAALICCLLGAMQPRKWHLVATGIVGAAFFSFIYQDTGKINRMEEQAVQLVSKLPPNQRVMATIVPPPGSRVLIQHIVDRACIERCFSYGNYEPSTAIFRVRAMPGNPYVMSSYDDVVDMENGEYTVQPEDLPAYQVYQCSMSGRDLCIRPLEADEDNDRLGLHPNN